MAEFTFGFTRKFQHEDWVDNQSRVQASGPDGFNQRFHALEADLDAVGDVVKQIEGAINSLGAAPPAQEVRMTFTPTLVATAGAGWSHTTGQASKPPGQESANGMMSIALPHGVKVLRFRVIGRNGGGDLSIELNRQLLRADTAEAVETETLARVRDRSDPFDRTEAVQAQFERVDNERFKYFVSAELNNSPPAARVVLMAFQVVYLTS